MAKFILCSKKREYTELKKCMEINFQESAKCCGDFGYLSAYKKLRIETQNCFLIGEEFAVGVGTFFYNNKKDKEALQDIWSNFNGDIASLRKTITGSYCLIIKKFHKVYVFVDAASTYNVYYSLDENGEISVTTTYYHLACISGTPKLDKKYFLAEWLHTIIREASMYEGIYKLTGDKILEFSDGKWKVENIEFLRKNEDDNLVEKVKKKYEYLRQFSKTGVFLTGGQDSRLSLSLLMSLGIKPDVYYGMGNSSDTSTKQKDLEIVKSLAKKYDLSIHFMNWNDSNQKDKKIYLDKYGELYTLYCMNKNFMKEFEEIIDVEFICFGYFGEIFRTIESIENYKKDSFSLREYMDDLYLSADKGLFKLDYYQEYRKKIYKLLQDFCKLENLDENHLNRDDFQKLNTVYRQRWDTQLNNFANLFTYSCPLFGDKEITDYAEAKSYSEKYNSRYQMKLMYQLEKGVLEIPFFSHIKTKEFNPETFELADASITSKGKDFVREIVKNPKLLYGLKIIYYILQRDNKGLQELRKEHQRKEQLKRMLIQNSFINDEIDLNKAVDSMDARRIKHVMLLEYLVKQVDNRNYDNL